MTTILYNPESQNRPYLPKAGFYGRGQENDADVQLFSVTQSEPGKPSAPYDDKQCDRDNYSVWTFRVVHDETVTFVRSRPQANTLPNTGSKNLPWINNLGIQPTGEDAETGYPSFELEKLSGIPCVIRVAAPRKDKNDPTVFYTGDVLDVLGLEG